MKTQAAALWEYGGDWEIDELTLDDPKAGEVLVRLAAAGLCHSDEHVRVGDLPMEELPAIGGHEGAGVVEAVGPEVHSVAEGDHVVLSWIPSLRAVQVVRDRARKPLRDRRRGPGRPAGRRDEPPPRARQGRASDVHAGHVFPATRSSGRTRWSRSTTTSRSTRRRWWAAGSPPASAPRCMEPRWAPATRLWCSGSAGSGRTRSRALAWREPAGSLPSIRRRSTASRRGSSARHTCSPRPRRRSSRSRR